MRRLALAAAALLLAGQARALRIERIPKAQAVGGSLEVVAEQALVRFDRSLTSIDKATRLSALGASVVGEFPKTGWTLVALPSGSSVVSGLTALKSLPGVLVATANHVYRLKNVPGDPFVNQQSALSQIDAFSAWDFETGFSNKVTVAMIDAGIEGTHEDLASKLLNSGGVQSQYFSPFGNGAQSSDAPVAACDHGTRTSGIVAAAANNGKGIAGMSWGAQLLSLRIFDQTTCNADCSDKASPGCFTTDVAISSAILYAVSLKGNAAVGRLVINMSIGADGAACTDSDGTTSVGAVRDAIAIATTAPNGIPVVVSAGNFSDAVNAPANCAGTTGGSGIIPVGAVDSNNAIAYFSSRGPELAANGVVAPGVSVETTDINNAYTSAATGTSFSAPHVAGLAALILSKKPSATPQQVQAWIQGGADNIGQASTLQGAGRINAFRTMRLATNGTLADFQGDQKVIAFPNPFRLSQTGSATITVPVSLQSSHTEIKIFTVDGQLVRVLGGLTWDGKNGDGAVVASGTYVLFVKTDKGSTRGRIAVIR